MSIFLILYFFFLGFFHLFFYLKLRIFLPFTNSGKLIYLFFSIILIFLPLIARSLERNGAIFIPTIFLFLFYFWISYLFIFNFFGILFLPFNFISSIKILLNKFLFILPVLIIFAGFIQDKFIKVKHFEIKNEKIKKPLKIGFISDLHLGLTQGKNKIEKILDILKKEKIDLLLAGGDLLDSSYHRDNLNLIRNFNPPLGKIAVFGNHEYYVGEEKSKEIIEEMGFKILRFEMVEMEKNLIIAGAEDETAKYFKKFWDEEGFLKKLPEDKFIIYLRHRPPREKLEKVDLCLSGHTHRGQFFPFSIITYFTFKFHSGFYKVDENFSIYVSSGAGTWGPPVRFLTTRDIAIFSLSP